MVSPMGTVVPERDADEQSEETREMVADRVETDETDETETPDEGRTYRVPVQNMAGLREKLEKMNRKAARLGLAPIVLTELGTETVERHDYARDPESILGLTIRQTYVTVEVTGTAPVIAGWHLIAVLDHTNGVTGSDGVVYPLIMAVPGESCPPAYRTAPPVCDHCGATRRRLKTYLLGHENGDRKLVGSNCLTSFLGGVSPQALTAWATMIAEVREVGEDAEGYGGGRAGEEALGLAGFVVAVAQQAHEYGFLSASKAQDNPYGPQPTGAATWDRLTDPKQAEPIVADARAIARGTAAYEWARGEFVLGQAEGDYAHTMAQIVAADEVIVKTKGYAASIYSGYERAMEREVTATVAAARPPSTHVGTVGTRGVFGPLTVTGVRELESQWGSSTLYSFVDEAGNILKWFCSSEPARTLADGTTTYGLSEGDVVSVKATVKEHQTYNGQAQTMVNRAVIL
jgi:hypothetical protein